jgi:hypothetical protein
MQRVENGKLDMWRRVKEDKTNGIIIDKIPEGGAPERPAEEVTYLPVLGEVDKTEQPIKPEQSAPLATKPTYR